MAFFEHIQGRQPGEPRPPAVPGGSQRPSMPAPIMNPPAVNSAPAGRPPMPPALPNITPGGFSPGGMVMPKGGGSFGAPNQGSKGEIWPDLRGGGMQEQVMQLGHLPTPQERASMPGFRLMTPYGEVRPDGSVVPSPQGAQQYQQAIVKAQKDFGSYPLSDMPGVPPPPIRLGGSWINPFSGTWGRAGG